jgi:hypothetical protein
MKKYTISGLAESCPLCIEGDGRKGQNKPIFAVGSEGGYTGPICARHLEALIKAEEPPRAAAAAVPAQTTQKPAQPVGNAVPVK